MTKITTLTGLAIATGLMGCAVEPFQKPIGHTSAGGDVLSQNFGVATASNIALQNIKGQKDLVMNLTRIFASNVSPMINFDFDSAELDELAKAQLRQQAQWMKDHPNITFRVFGHTDKVGGNAYNRRLGQRRANVAVAYLVSLGVPRNKVDGVVSLGETRPLVLTDGRSRANRRTVTEVKGFYRPGAAPIDGKYALGIYNRYVTEHVRVKTPLHPEYAPPTSSKAVGVKTGGGGGAAAGG